MSNPTLILSCCLLVLVGCGDTNPKDTAPGDTSDTQDGGLSHATDIQPIWDASCSGCHTNGGSQGSLVLDDGYAATVGVPSTQVPSMNLVEATSADASYLWHKLQGTQANVAGSGDQMPPSGPLDANDLSLIEAWINEAAQP